MSHFTKLAKAQITSADAFIAACAELGFKTVTRNAKARGYRGDTMDADVVIAVPGGNYDIALVKDKKTGRYDCIADWMMAWAPINAALPEGRTPFQSQKAVQDWLLKTTTKHTIIQKYRRLGFRATVTEDEDENLTLQLVRN